MGVGDGVISVVLVEVVVATLVGVVVVTYDLG